MRPSPTSVRTCWTQTPTCKRIGSVHFCARPTAETSGFSRREGKSKNSGHISSDIWVAAGRCGRGFYGFQTSSGRHEISMRKTFDRRVLSDSTLDFVRACQQAVPCHLAGGAALSGAYLSHRLSADIDLFCHDIEHARELKSQLPKLSSATGIQSKLLRDSGSHVRAQLTVQGKHIELDIVHESRPDLEPPPPPIEEVVVESLVDIRAAKLTCLLSRSEPRDLVDLYFLERAGFPPDADIQLALRKDAGIDPAVLAWLLRSFPISPMPLLLQELTAEQLTGYRDDLAERFRRIAAAGGD